MTNVISLKNIKKDYKTSNEKLEVLKGVDYTFEKGNLYAIKGHSGSGKTTLIKILGLLENPTSGEYLLFNKKQKIFLIIINYIYINLKILYNVKGD